MLDIPQAIRDCKLEDLTYQQAKQLDLHLIGEGGTRRTYIHRSETFVIKVPKYDSTANYSEAEGYQRYAKASEEKRKHMIPLAECELLDNGWLAMEVVQPISEPRTGHNDLFPKKPPGWVRLLDCEQAGWTTRGERRLVAFDYPYRWSQKWG